ncbi:unnamed protein product [Linum tenue]|uniref:Uncharacterized protein n=1 Tax=Linum tenue TaxID=586396 RepID=A0AAV0MGI4_9ROSI|nr:unnamed protein product [Linum tenue]
MRLIQSNFCRKSGDVRPPLASPSLHFSLFGSSELASKQLNHLGSVKPQNWGCQLSSLSSNLRKGAPTASLKLDVQTGRNSGSQLKPRFSEMRKGAPPPLLVGMKNVQSTATNSFCKDHGVQEISVLNDYPILADKVVDKGEPVILRSVSNMKDPDNTRKGSSVDKITKLNISRSMKSSLPATRSIPSSKDHTCYHT